MQGLSKLRNGVTWGVRESPPCKIPVMTQKHTPPAEIVITHPDELEVEISSGAMTRLAGVSQLLLAGQFLVFAVDRLRVRIRVQIADFGPLQPVAVAGRRFSQGAPFPDDFLIPLAHDSRDRCKKK